MRDLLPQSVYDQVSDAQAQRLSLVMAVLWAVPMTVLVARDPPGLPLGILVLISVVMGLVFGFMWTHFMLRSTRRLRGRIYRSDPAVVPPPPEGAYEWRVLCSWMRSPRMAVGGHLYAGSGAWTFVPHRKNLRAHQAPFSIRPSPDVRVTAVEEEARGLARLFVAGPVRRLRIDGPGDGWVFMMPETDYVAGELRRLLPVAGGVPLQGAG